MSEYKKCPMCGGDVAVRHHTELPHKGFSIYCLNCMLKTRICATRTEAKNVWNKRCNFENMDNKLVYICSPYRGNIKFNIMEAQRISRQVVLAGGLPIAPHLLFTQFLDDNIDEERHLAFKMNEKLLDLCDLVVAKNGTISDGMRRELDYLQGSGKEVIWVD